MTTAMNTKTYSELINCKTFLDRYRYLKIGGNVGEDTFGYSRYLNQVLYRSSEWRRFRREVIIRDKGGDLGIEELPIVNNIFVHHINPITLYDVKNRSSSIFDFENVICCSFDTHQAIHYGDESLLRTTELVERTPFDHCPWRL